MSNTAKTHTAANYAPLQRRRDADAKDLDAKRKRFIPGGGPAPWVSALFSCARHFGATVKLA